MDSLQEYFNSCRELPSDSDEDCVLSNILDSAKFSVNPSSTAPLELQHVYVGQERSPNDTVRKNGSAVQDVASSRKNTGSCTQQILFSQLSSKFPLLSFSESVSARENQCVCDNAADLPRVAHPSSYIPEDEADLRRLYSIMERTDAILFDTLCSLRQGENKSCILVPLRTARKKKNKKDLSSQLHSEGCCTDGHPVVEHMTPCRWRLRKKVRKELQSLGVENYALALQPLLNIASDVAELKRKSNLFRSIHSAALSVEHLSRVCSYALGDAVEFLSDYLVGKHEVLGNAGCSTLLRFSSLIENLLEDFFQWVLQLLEFHSTLREKRSAVTLETALGWVWEKMILPFHSNRKSPFEEVDEAGAMGIEEEELGCWARCLPFRHLGRFTEESDFLLSDIPAVLRSSFQRLSEKKGTMTSSSAWLDMPTLVTAVQQNVLPLQRWLTVLNESQCFDHFFHMIFQHSNAGNSKALCYEAGKKGGFASSWTELLLCVSTDQYSFVCARQAALLLDFLVVRSSELQNTSNFDLYRCYVALVMHLSWPYFDLSTAAMHGFVHVIDLDVWRLLLPRMFRVSFSHFRVNGVDEEHPTDVLSLILNCVDYCCNDRSSDPSYTGSSHSPTAGTSPSMGSFANSSEFPALITARQNILQSCAAFCGNKRKTNHGQIDFLENKVHPSPYNFFSEELASNDGDCDGELPLGFIVPNLNPPLQSTNHEQDWKQRAPGIEMCEAEALPEKWMPPLFWCLHLREARASSDVLILRRPLSSERQNGMDENSWTISKPPEFIRKQKIDVADLRINTAIPCTRWLTAALLVPLGMTAQCLQKRRLQDLYLGIQTASLSLSTSRPLSTSFFFLEDSISHDSSSHRRKKRRHDISASLFALSSTGGVEQRQLQEATNRPLIWSGAAPFTASVISLPNAMRLIIDVALCGNREFIIDGFVRQLYLKSLEQNWLKISHTNGEKETAIVDKKMISYLFSEAIRGIPYAELVQLVVTSPEGITSSSATSPSGQESQASSMTDDLKRILDVFSSFQLQFSFPEQLVLVLFPNTLTFYINHALGQLQRTYDTFFWQKRRGKAEGFASPSSLASSCSFKKSEIANERCGSVPFSDVWSSIFGYLVALHYAQMHLRCQQKLLHKKDLQLHDLKRSQMNPDPQRNAHQNMLSRGFGGAFYCLAFVLDTLISFTMHEVLVVVYELENAFIHRSAFNSAPLLCKRLDQLLLQLQLISFPSLAPYLTSREDSLSIHSLGEAIRARIADIVCLALDPTRFTFRFLMAKTKSGVEKLISAVSSCAIQSPLLHMRLKPLIYLLTFNHYYGDDAEGYRFR